MPLPLPEVLKQWLIINVEFCVIICYCPGCQYAVCPGIVNRYLRDKHQVQAEDRKQVDEYLKQWQWQYNFQTVRLPEEQSLPLPQLLTLAGF